MTTEELKIKISVDTSELKRNVTQAKKTIQSLNDSTSKSIKGATGGTTASIQELQDTMEQMRNLDIAAYITAQFEKVQDTVSEAGAAIKTAMKAAGQWSKLAGQEILGAFDFKNFNTDEGFLGYLGSMKVALGEAAKSAKMATGQIGQAFKVMGQTIASTLGPLMTKIALFAAVIAAAANVVNTFQTAARLKQMNAEAQKIGLSVNGYQEWAYVLERVGVGADKLSDFIKTLSDEQNAVREGAEDMTQAFNRLGLSVEQVSTMSQEALFTETVKRLQNVENEVERTSLAYKIFGEDAAELANVLRLTNDETADLASTVHLLGNTISGGLLTKTTALNTAVSNLKMAWRGLTNTLAELFMPAITAIVNWLTKAIVVVNLFFKTIFGLDMTPAASAIQNVGGSVQGVGGAANDATAAMEKLKRATMGFDELNIVSAETSSKQDSGSTGTGAQNPGGIIESTGSAFEKAKGKIDEFQKKIEDFFSKWKTEIQIVSAGLAGLALGKILTDLTNALGLTETFGTKLSNLKKISGAAITITLQYSLVEEFMDNYINGEGFKEYLKGLLVAAIGTGVLYALWGPTGLMIGLGVTAVASLKTVFENGGITDIESATVALTGLASAIGAVIAAVKIFNLGAVLGDIGAFIALLKEGNSLGSVLAATFPKVAKVLAPVGTAIKAVVAGITALGGGSLAAGLAIVAAAIAAVAGVVIFLKENWDEVTEAIKKFFETNIAPKLEEIKESWNHIKEVLRDALPESVIQWFKDAGEWIGNMVKKIGEWFASVDWIKAIGEVFEWIGGIIVAVVGGVIAGAIDAFIEYIKGLVKYIEGVVDIVSGVIDAIVGLCTGDLDRAREGVQKIVDGIVKCFKGMYDMTIGVVVEFVKGIIDWCVKLWDELVGHSIIPDMVEAIVEWFEKLYDDTIGVIVKFVEDIIAKIKKMWDDIKSWFNTNVAPKFTKDYWTKKFDTIKQGSSEKLGETKKKITSIWDEIKKWFTTSVAPKFTKKYWTDKFDTVRSGSSEKLNAAKQAIVNIWNGIKTWFTTSVAPKFTKAYWAGKFQSIVDGATQKLNELLSTVRNIWNSITGILSSIGSAVSNTISNVGNWFSGLSFGGWFGGPRMATGGIVTRSTIANIGEAGREAVLPLENNTGWMDQLADRIAARNSAPTKIVLKVGERELGQATIKSINQITKQTGGLQLQLV